MLSKEKWNSKSKLTSCNHTLGSDKNFHELGLSFLCSYLDRVGFSILEVNTDPNHHFQLLAKINEKSLLIAVRTAYSPEVGTIDASISEKLVKESNDLNALPHFAGLTIAPEEMNDIEVEGVTLDQKYKVVFNGISAVGKSDIKEANG